MIISAHINPIILSETENNKKLNIEIEKLDIHNQKAKEYIPKFSERKSKYFKDYAKGEVIINKENKEYIGYICIWKDWMIPYKDKNNNEKEVHGNMVSPVEVAKKYRGQGFGKMLLEDAINKWDANMLLVYNDNTVVLNLYKKYNFKKIGDSVSKEKRKLIVMKK